VLKPGARGVEQGADIPHHLFGLDRDAAVDDFPGCRIDRYLSR
jgi:hypothetical protein